MKLFSKDYIQQKKDELVADEEKWSQFRNACILIVFGFTSLLMSVVNFFYSSGELHMDHAGLFPCLPDRPAPAQEEGLFREGGAGDLCRRNNGGFHLLHHIGDPRGLQRAVDGDGTLLRTADVRVPHRNAFVPADVPFAHLFLLDADRQ